MPFSLYTNIFAGNPLDRVSGLRNNPDWLQERFDDRRSVAIALWNGQPLVREAQDGFQLSCFPLSAAADISRIEERRLFLGLKQEAAVFAFDFEGEADPAEGPLKARGEFANLRAIALQLTMEEAAIAATAKAVFEWHRRHRFCSSCGAPSFPADGGWKRVCRVCATEHFPRTDPVVIMLPARGDRCLLGRQANWPAGMWSALAGFLEPGESIEEACARELKEEASLETLSVRYHSSQPWPYPSSLMIGLFAEVAGEGIADEIELEALRWFTKEEARDLLDGKIAGAFAPARMAIAHVLLKAWVEGC